MPEPSLGRHGLSFRQGLLESLDSLRVLGHRSLLALLGIAVGSAAVVALLNIGHNAANDAISAFKGLGANTLVVTLPPRPGAVRRAPSSLDTAALTAALPGIGRVAPITPHAARIRHAGRFADATIVGTTEDLAPMLGLRIDQGRFLSDFDRQATYAVVGARLAHDLAVRPGSHLQIEGYLFEVVGVAASQPPMPLVSVASDQSVFVPIEGMRRLRPAPEIGRIVAQVGDTTRLADHAAALKTYLEGVVKGREADVQISQHLLDGLARQANTFSYLLAGLGGISLVVGGVGVMNVMLMNVAERRREIGVRMAIGAQARDIRNLFLSEAAALSVAGALLGAAVGLASAYAFVRFSGWTFSLSMLSLPLGVFSALAIGLFFGLHPALAAARLQPVQALRDD